MLLNNVLVVGKSESAQQLFRPIADNIYSADEISDALDIIQKQQLDLTIADETVSHESKCTLLEIAKNQKLPPIVIISSNSIDSDIQYTNAFDVIDTPTDVRRITELAQKIKAAEPAIDQHNTSTQFIIGRSKASIKTLELIDLVAKSRCNPILIIGETGTGKEMAARRVHELRHGSGAPYVAINCAALSSSLLESELFGHVKGAFTGADREKTGLLEMAQNGTVLLDEISEMPLDLQAKLLRVLQERTFRKVGGLKELTCTATIIASSNRNLYKEAQIGKFRQDLYYRLSVCPITISPLRSPERKDDILLLAEHFLKISTICPNKIKSITGFTKFALEAMFEYSWPGNVRELRNVIERAILLETTDKIGLSSLIFNPEQNIETSTGQTVSSIADFSLEKAEKELIARALKQAGWQKTRAASLLGITRATLYAKISQYDIKVPAINELSPAEAAA